MIEKELKKFKLDMVLDYPMFMPLLVRMKFKEMKGDVTAATDGKYIYIGNNFNKFSKEDKQSILFHELLHVAFLHNPRMKALIEDGYSQELINIAEDYIVNNFLSDKINISKIPGCVYNLPGIGDYKTETVEGICKKLKKDGYEKPTQFEIDVKPTTNKNGKKIEAEIKNALAEGIILQSSMPGNSSGNLTDFIEKLLKPEVDWIRILKRYITTERDRFSRSYNKINRKKSFLYKFKFILPGDDKVNKKLNLVLALDTSGSMSYEDLQKAISEINAMKVFSNTTIIQADYDINKITTNFKDFRQIEGRGGTSFVPVIEWIIKNKKKQDNTILIYFSDMEGDQTGKMFTELYRKAKQILRKDYWVNIQNGKIEGIKNNPCEFNRNDDNY